MATNEKLTKLLLGRKVDSVRQRGAELDIDFGDGSTLSLKLAGATQSIILMDTNEKKEYAD
jgi:hypothetical protein